ncbi:MAG TPA: hypothetical protein VI861_00455, partial [Rickettsiales bacterium]|nr:hypothetical protein [Rickettsiales bacterium]
MLITANIAIIFSLILIAIKFFVATNSYEKIIAFYFIFGNFIILILINAVTGFNAVIDIAIILILLQ